MHITVRHVYTTPMSILEATDAVDVVSITWGAQWHHSFASPKHVRFTKLVYDVVLATNKLQHCYNVSHTVHCPCYNASKESCCNLEGCPVESS
jgi:hypothetical protein